jgi:hypothetical protein
MERLSVIQDQHGAQGVIEHYGHAENAAEIMAL